MGFNQLTNPDALVALDEADLPWSVAGLSGPGLFFFFLPCSCLVPFPVSLSALLFVCVLRAPSVRLHASFPGASSYQRPFSPSWYNRGISLSLAACGMPDERSHGIFRTSATGGDLFCYPPPGFKRGLAVSHSPRGEWLVASS